MSNIEKPTRPGTLVEQPGGRPVGVILIASICFFFVAALALYLVDSALVLRDAGSLARAGLEPQWLLAALVLIPACALVGVGLLRLRNWARYAAIGGLALAIGGLVVRGLGMSPLDYGLRYAFAGSLLPVAIILYLLHPSIRPAFRSGRR